MNNVKKALVAVGAMLALAGQVQAQSYPTEPPGAVEGYMQFGVEMHNFCHALVPTDGTDGLWWGCVFHDNRPDPGVYTSNNQMPS